MNEFIKKLIERLEEELLNLTFQSTERNKGFNDGIYKGIEIVNQLAEEQNNDFCEWKFEENKGVVYHCKGQNTYNPYYAINLRIVADDFDCKCPYCGKKIKVV